ncbi:MAG: DUF3352 domain-containing protein [Solirubrobacteraceae bacterium]
MPEVTATDEAAPTSAPERAYRPTRRPTSLLAAVAALVIIVVVVLIVFTGGSGNSAPDTSAAGLVPADALAYVNLSLDGSRPPVKQALAVVRRLPNFSLAGPAALSRLGAIISGGGPVDFETQISPWLGDQAALALLNTTTSTAGALVVLAVKNHDRAMKFVTSEGATAHGSYRGKSLLAYSSGIELAFIGNHLVLGQPASVQSAIDVASGATPALAAAAVYKRASAAQPSGRVLDAYASLAGVRRLLADQSGVLGALGGLLYQPALQGVALSVTPTQQGARVLVNSALDPTLTQLHGASSPPFTPTLQDVLPSGASLMLDVSGLDKAAPAVLNAGSEAGVAGAIGPLLARLGTALKAEGVNVSNLVSIFDHEAAVAILPGGKSPALVVVARASDPSKVKTELADLEVPLAQLFQTKGQSSSSEPVFDDRQVAGVTAHQLALTTGLQLDYAVFRGLVVISTSLQGIAAVAQPGHTLASDPGFRATLASRPKLVTGLVYLALGKLLALSSLTGLTNSSAFNAIRGDLSKLTAVGVASTRSPNGSQSQLTIAIP